ncbi:MAG: hypothetical protein GFH27_549281n34 [Chloroflexi bacterium AL-W]|nr:hypothetical protein [Chloroflexi bacterium AL-N1]NOK65920.1 hypothetical protein [Chloroflexi bacterium AL-N10]NOK72801.1 hypothetical protein [Chloroflexi bacterium AL-N5]NOK79698.1 hypothetical protein [Chloroflexi bacterium AL-W]NOK93023.1 hypothetical protein [Chloroflexi bacterium AL-N15]
MIGPESMQTPSLTRIIDDFLAMWCNARSHAQPSIHQIGAIRHVHFAKPPATGKQTRFDEFFLSHFERPDEVVALVQRTIGTTPHWLTVFSSNPIVLKNTYASFGYTSRADEYLMQLPSLTPTEASEQPAGPVQRIHSTQEAEWLNTQAGTTVAEPTRVNDPTIGYYYIKLDEQLAAYGLVSMVANGLAGLDRIHTAPAYRRRGLASALLTAMHYDAAQQGSATSILISTPEGRPLYQRFGYQDVSYVTVLESPDFT